MPITIGICPSLIVSHRWCSDSNHIIPIPGGLA